MEPFEFSKDAFSRLFLFLFGTPFIGMYLRKRIFEKNLPKKNIENIFDAGCGNGIYSFLLAKKFPSAKVTGIDIGDNGYSCCIKVKKKAGFPNVKFEKTGLLEFNPEERFDLAVFFEVWQYMEKKEAIKKLSSLLLPGGRLFVSIPAKNWFSGRPFRNAISSKAMEESCGFKESDLLPEKQIEELFSESGLKIRKMQKFFGFFGNLSWGLEFIFLHSGMRRFYYIIFPILKGLAFFDSLLGNPDGRELFIIAEKKGTVKKNA